MKNEVAQTKLLPYGKPPDVDSKDSINESFIDVFVMKTLNADLTWDKMKKISINLLLFPLLFPLGQLMKFKKCQN